MINANSNDTTSNPCAPAVIAAENILVKLKTNAIA